MAGPDPLLPLGIPAIPTPRRQIADIGRGERDDNG